MKVQFIRGMAHSSLRWRARRAGVTIDPNAYVSPEGRYQVYPEAKIILSEGVSLFSRHHIIAYAGAEVYLGKNVHFEDGMRLIAHPHARIHIEDGCWFNDHVSIVAMSEITIGQFGIFAPRCYVTDHNHGIVRNQLMRDQECVSQPLSVGSDVWFGVGVTVVMGARVGDGAVLAAGAVVNKHVPDYEIWGGVPAKRIGERPLTTTARNSVDGVAEAVGPE